MNLYFDLSLAEQYRSKSQILRVLTETWFAKNMFCPRCGSLRINRFQNNRPVADFYCPNCKSEYELKSKSGKIDTKINNGAYTTMIRRITENNNPDLFCMRYDKIENAVTDLIFIPKYFFTPNIIEKRNPLKETARRSNWIGCNILVEKIPSQAKIRIITNKTVHPVVEIMDKVKQCDYVQTKDIKARTWLLDILNCINALKTQEFSLHDVYQFENQLAILHSENNNIRPKIRQQLQFLRDKSFVEFLGNGKYRKI